MDWRRILLADDHAVMRRGLRALLQRHPDFCVATEASDGRQAVQLAESLRPDVVVTDISMPNLNGTEAARQITAKLPGTAVVILSMPADESYALRALKAGARGYLLKHSAEEDLTNAIRTVHAGKSFSSPAVSKLLVADYVRHLNEKDLSDSYELLTAREREILQLVAEDRRNPSRQHDGKAEPAHGSGTDPLRRSQRPGLIFSLSRAHRRARASPCRRPGDHPINALQLNAKAPHR